MLKSLARGWLIQLKNLIARYWIDPLDVLLWEMVGLDQTARWQRLRPILIWVRDLGRLIYEGFRVNIYRWDGPEWSVIYLSEDATDSQKELQHLLFSEAPIETALGRAFIWQLPGLVRRFVPQDCLVVCEMNRLIQWQIPGIYCVRAFPRLRAFLDISMPMDAMIKRMMKDRVKDVSKKLKKYDFEYRVSHDLADFELFYYKMHLPYITERYRDRARIHSYENLRNLFEQRGELLYIKYQNQLVAANLGVLRRYGKTFSALIVGVDEEQVGQVKPDILVALHWHVISWAHANHLHLVDFGWTQARLNDGLFEFKRRWGMRFERDILTHTRWTFAGKRLPVALIRRLNDLALIAEVGKEYRCVVFENDRAGLGEEELTRREKVSAQVGLDGLLVLPAPV